MNRPFRGERHDDPPEQGWRYRVALAVEKYPVLVGATIAMIVATVALVVVLKNQSDLRTEKASNVRLTDAALGSCRRLQILRDRENHTSALLYLTFITGAQREEVLAKGPNGAINALQAKIERTMGEAARFTPSTDCQAAVHFPKTYKPPQPIPFTMKLAKELEPRAARNLVKASKKLISYERRLLASLGSKK